jgi:hypothetical protein
MKFVLIAVVLVVLLFASGNLKVEFWARASAPPATTQIDMRSATVRDVVALVAALSSAQTDLDNAQSTALVARFERDHDRAAASAIERAWPPLSRRLDRKFARMYRRAAAVPIETHVGKKCRTPTLLFVRRQRAVFHRFAVAVRQHGATANAVKSFGRQNESIQAWYSRALNSCTANASPEDHEALEPVLSG